MTTAGTVSATVDLARVGDAEAFGALYARYRDQVHRYLVRRTGDRDLADDLTSETFTRALARIGAFAWQGRDFGAWLTTIARNLAADHAKCGPRRFEVPVAAVRGAGTEPSPEEIVVDEMARAADAQKLTRACAAVLTERQRQCLKLRFWHEMTPLQVARAMGCNSGAAKTLQYRAVGTLRRALRPKRAVAGGAR
jgi:RNA polymerase sigma-70 factor (ECF subfamily)